MHRDAPFNDNHMKKTTIAILSIALILTAFTTNTMVTEKKRRISSSEQMAERVVAALQQANSKEYMALFPTLSDFKEIMKANAGIYGSNLNEAQREFSNSYETKLLPAVKNSFAALVLEGREKGIDWSKVRYVGIELESQPQQHFSPVPVNIVISSRGIEHRIQIERALVINGEWKVSQFVKLI